MTMTPQKPALANDIGPLIPPDELHIGWWSAIVSAAVAVASFRLAYEFPSMAFLMGVYLFCLARLAWVRTGRMAFYLGLGIGVAAYAPQLWFFVGIFKVAAIAMWLILSIWIALFLVLARACLKFLPRRVAILSMPILWTGLEYFRSELYYPRFSWVNVGFAFSHSPTLFAAGVYGAGFFLMLGVAILYQWELIGQLGFGVLFLIALAVVVNRPSSPSAPGKGPFLVGIQLERARDADILTALDGAIGRYPQADLLVLSEYTFGGPPPDRITDWCREHQKYLIAGGVAPVSPTSEQYYNTAFVVGPDGRIAFQQAKSVPIQFFTDGLPAEKQAIWQSPWGPIGLCICYDLGYSRVVDRLERLGAGAIIVPTMDMIAWGEHEHELHARVGPTRAAEYGLPVVRVCSSGISQIISHTGVVQETAPFPGQGETVAGVLDIQPAGRLPIDRTLAPICVGLTGAIAIGLGVATIRRRATLKAFQTVA